MQEVVDGLVVIPGDLVTSKVANSSEKQQVKLGPGLYYDETNEVIASKSGILRHKKPDTYWVDCHQRRYIPCKGENVLGVVTSKQGELYKVDIGGSDQAGLNYLAFEGASKRNSPKLANGDVVFCKVIAANKDTEPEVTCVDPSNNKANGLGPLSEDGFVFGVSLDLGRKLLSPDCVLLPELGSRHPFEIIVGLNGKIALFCKSPRLLIAIMNVILASELMSNTEILNVVNNMFG